MKKLIFLFTTFISLNLYSQLELPLPQSNYEQVGPYCDTNKCGRWITYYKDGNIAMVETFDEEGRLKGERFTFRTDGTVKHYTEWEYGIKVGKEIFFDENGYPIEVIYIKKNDSHKKR